MSSISISTKSLILSTSSTLVQATALIEKGMGRFIGKLRECTHGILQLSEEVLSQRKRGDMTARSSMSRHEPESARSSTLASLPAAAVQHAGEPSDQSDRLGGGIASAAKAESTIAAFASASERVDEATDLADVIRMAWKVKALLDEFDSTSLQEKLEAELVASKLLHEQSSVWGHSSPSLAVLHTPKHLKADGSHGSGGTSDIIGSPSRAASAPTTSIVHDLSRYTNHPAQSSPLGRSLSDLVSRDNSDMRASSSDYLIKEPNVGFTHLDAHMLIPRRFTDRTATLTPVVAAPRALR